MAAQQSHKSQVMKHGPGTPHSTIESVRTGSRRRLVLGTGHKLPVPNQQSKITSHESLDRINKSEATLLWAACLVSCRPPLPFHTPLTFVRHKPDQRCENGTVKPRLIASLLLSPLPLLPPPLPPFPLPRGPLLANPWLPPFLAHYLLHCYQLLRKIIRFVCFLCPGHPWKTHPRYPSRHTPGSTPGRTPRCTPGHSLGCTPRYAPWYPPGHTPGYAPGYSSSHGPGYIRRYAPGYASGRAPGYASGWPRLGVGVGREFLRAGSECAGG